VKLVNKHQIADAFLGLEMLVALGKPILPE
jgi:hypothetical protein